MQTQWDYTKLASHYVKRPSYADEAIRQMCEIAGLGQGGSVCDVGAGTGHLTRLLLARGLEVTAVEPNDAMRALGIQTTHGGLVRWTEGTGESTGQADHVFDLVTFGSSFNTTNRIEALREAARILKPRAWFACMWNHRDLNDPLQSQVEATIRSEIDGYDYGTRREDQTSTIEASGLFESPRYLEGHYQATVDKNDYIDAWRSHATLQRQAKDRFAHLISRIEVLLADQEQSLIVPYTTRLWMARLL